MLIYSVWHCWRLIESCKLFVIPNIQQQVRKAHTIRVLSILLQQLNQVMPDHRNTTGLNMSYKLDFNSHNSNKTLTLTLLFFFSRTPPSYRYACKLFMNRYDSKTTTKHTKRKKLITQINKEGPVLTGKKCGEARNLYSIQEQIILLVHFIVYKFGPICNSYKSVIFIF